RLAHPARKRNFNIGRRAVIAPSNDFYRLAHRVAVEHRASRLAPGRAILEKQGSGPTDQFFRRIAELPVRGWISELNSVLVVEGENDVRRAVDHCVISRVLS